MQETRCGGVDFTPFTEAPEAEFHNGFLYYGESKLTDNYYIKHCYVYDNELSNAGRHRVFCIGQIKKGSYICTCPFYGVSMQGANEETSFAICLEDKSDYEVGLIDVVFL